MATARSSVARRLAHPQVSRPKTAAMPSTPPSARARPAPFSPLIHARRGRRRHCQLGRARCRQRSCPSVHSRAPVTTQRPSAWRWRLPQTRPVPPTAPRLSAWQIDHPSPNPFNLLLDPRSPVADLPFHGKIDVNPSLVGEAAATPSTPSVTADPQPRLSVLPSLPMPVLEEEQFDPGEDRVSSQKRDGTAGVKSRANRRERRAGRISFHARSYYKCTNSRCGAKKHVNKSTDDPEMLIVTYEGPHLHGPQPLFPRRQWLSIDLSGAAAAAASKTKQQQAIRASSPAASTALASDDDGAAAGHRASKIMTRGRDDAEARGGPTAAAGEMATPGPPRIGRAGDALSTQPRLVLTADSCDDDGSTASVPPPRAAASFPHCDSPPTTTWSFPDFPFAWSPEAPLLL